MASDDLKWNGKHGTRVGLAALSATVAVRAAHELDAALGEVEFWKAETLEIRNVLAQVTWDKDDVLTAARRLGDAWFDGDRGHEVGDANAALQKAAKAYAASHRIAVKPRRPIEKKKRKAKR